MNKQKHDSRCVLICDDDQHGMEDNMDLRSLTLMTDLGTH